MPHENDSRHGNCEECGHHYASQRNCADCVHNPNRRLVDNWLPWRDEAAHDQVSAPPISWRRPEGMACSHAFHGDVTASLCGRVKLWTSRRMGATDGATQCYLCRWILENGTPKSPFRRES
jgi:hypothetical protein